MHIVNQHIGSWIEIFALVSLFAPLLSAIVSTLIPSRYLWVVSLTAPLCLLLGLVSSLLLLFYGWQTEPYLYSIPWFTLGGYPVSAGLQIDDLTILMVFVVSTISFLVHLFSTGYMAGDRDIKRYFVMLGFFTFAMIGVVLADNLLLLFIFWELVGFASYMLIGHYTEKPSAASAAKKAFIMNRIGDIAFLIGIMIIWSNTNTFQIFFLKGEDVSQWQTLASLCLFGGVIGKSAQFPLLTWLPDAMTGPTPVSALIHAATMVAAGVFLLARVLFLFSPEALDVVILTGIITSVVSAVAALVQYDIKKILAYSTVSQLGFMVLALGTGTKESGILHLFTHAFFKAGLFLAAGSIIHSVTHALHKSDNAFDPQDIRNLSGLRKFLPVTFYTVVICGASLSGFPLFSGFQSKESILASLMEWAGGHFSWRWIVVGLAFIVSFCTVCYTFRLLWYLFFRQSHSDNQNKLILTESPFVMRLPMIVLSLASLWWVVSWNPINFSGWYFEFKGDHLVLTFVSIGWILAAFLVVFLYYKNKKTISSESGLRSLLLNGFYLDFLYKRIFVRAVEHIAIVMTWLDMQVIDRVIHSVAYGQIIIAHVMGWMDRVFIDGSVNGAARIAGGIGSMTRSIQGGKIQYYVFWALLGMVSLVFFLLS